ncbi:MAG: hypothetical protein KBT21_09765 [Treponema sp.]|nr:hypothetical protein [Candidatus Treponema merdequi]
MNKQIAALLICCSALIFSCTITKQTAFTQPSVSDVNYLIDTESLDISAEVDYIKSDDIAKQMSQVLYSSFSTFNKEKNTWPDSYPKTSVTVEVKITQRSYMRGVDQYNSIFVCYNLYDENKNILMQNCINRESKDTVISCIEQNKLAKIITENITKYLSQNVERKNLKKSAKENGK